MHGSATKMAAAPHVVPKAKPYPIAATAISPAADRFESGESGVPVANPIPFVKRAHFELRIPPGSRPESCGDGLILNCLLDAKPARQAFPEDDALLLAFKLAAFAHELHIVLGSAAMG